MFDACYLNQWSLIVNRNLRNKNNLEWTSDKDELSSIQEEVE